MGHIINKASKIIICIGTAVAVSLTAPVSAYNNDFLEKQLDAMDKQIDRYERIVDDGGWPAYTHSQKVEPGQTSQAVATLREILSITGDYKTTETTNWNRSAPTAPKQLSTNFYDSVLEQAVRNFQTRHALDSDGVIGPATRKALNVPAVDRLAQLHVAKQRIEEFKTANSGYSNGIIVNIPGFQLYGLKDGDVAEQMKVVVGRYDRKTPLFTNMIDYMSFNPRWYVPNSIATKDILPKIKNDPEYVKRAGFKLTQAGQQVDATSIDWENVDRSNFNYNLTQGSGRGNALGKVKFVLPDNRAIYLHDTSKRYLFKKGYRALSSGCVRVENPLALTKYVLDQSGQSGEYDAEKVYNSTATKRINLLNPVPVNTVYWSAWVDQATGAPHFYGDVYKMDRQLIADKKRELTGELRVAAK